MPEPGFRSRLATTLVLSGNVRAGGSEARDDARAGRERTHLPSPLRLLGAALLAVPIAIATVVAVVLSSIVMVIFPRRRR